MADLPPYARDFSFSGYQANKPRDPLPGLQIDRELDEIAKHLIGFGKSAFEIAQANGFTGSVGEWLLSLVGAQGLQGIQGVPGVPGTPGATTFAALTDVTGPFSALNAVSALAQRQALGFPNGLVDTSIVATIDAAKIALFNAGNQLRSVDAEIRDLTANAKRFGLKGDGGNDTGAFADYLRRGPEVKYLPPGQYCISDLLPIITGNGGRIIGAGQGLTTIKCTVNDLPALLIFANATTWSLENLTLDISAVNVRGVHAYGNCAELKFVRTGFYGGTADSLVLIDGGTDPKLSDGIVFIEPNFVHTSTSAWGLTLDTWPHNITLLGGRTYGPGNGLRVVQSDYTNAGLHCVEGLQVLGHTWINAGAYNVQLGKILDAAFVACCFDQTSRFAVALSKDYGGGCADEIMIAMSYLGTAPGKGVGTTGVETVGLFAEPGYNGNGVRSVANSFYNLDYGIQARAPSGGAATNCMNSITSSMDMFRLIAKAPILLDSVGQARVIGSEDRTTGAQLTASLGFTTLSTIRAGTLSLVGTSFPKANLAGNWTYIGAGNTDAFATIGGFVGCSVSANGTVVANQQDTIINWNTEDFQTGGMHSSGDPASLYVPGSTYMVELTLMLDWSSTTTGQRYAYISKNGGRVTPITVNEGTIKTGPINVVPSDKFFVTVNQNSGGNLTLGAATKFKMTKLG